MLEALTGNDVRFVVIGGLAGQMHGSPSITMDLDICPQRSDENLDRLAAALRELGARLRGAKTDVPFILDRETLKAGDHFTFTTESGSLDVLGTPSGARGGFDELDTIAATIDLDGLCVRVCALDDLIRMKRAAGRPKDLIEVEVLAALRDELDGAE